MAESERIVITVHPPPSDSTLLTVADAMQQVLDALRLFEEAGRAMVSPNESFDWRLEQASAESPFTVTAIAIAKNPQIDVTSHVRTVKSAVSSGLNDLFVEQTPPWWMGPEAINVARSVFSRNMNGVWRTDIQITPTDTITIDQNKASDGISALGAIAAISIGDDLAERTAWGEIEGVMVAAGRYRNKPAIQIRTEMHGFVWCQLSPELIEKFGAEHKMADVWEGKSLGVQGRLMYAAGGKLSRIEADDIREMPAVAPIDLVTVLDPDFTAGLDPIEYLRKLHEGDLA